MYALLTAYDIYRREKNMKTLIELTLLTYLFTVNVLISSGCPHEAEDAKAAYKSGEIPDMSQPITLDVIKRKLKDSGLFDEDNVKLNNREKKELDKLFEAVEIMTTSRNRQPPSVQNVYSSLRIVERAVKKMLKEGQISDSLAAKFNWDRLNNLKSSQIFSVPTEKNFPAPEKPLYFLDRETNMRVFNTQ